MPNKRYTVEQKVIAIMTLLKTTHFPLSETAIGHRLGYKNGIPIKGALEQLQREGLLIEYGGNFRGNDTTYFVLKSQENEETMEALSKLL